MDFTSLAMPGTKRQFKSYGNVKNASKMADHPHWDRDGIQKLTVNTCTLDHPRALAVYQKNGFKPVRREEKSRILKRDRDLSRIPS